jgi:hypothetical protein
LIATALYADLYPIEALSSTEKFLKALQSNAFKNFSGF